MQKSSSVVSLWRVQNKLAVAVQLFLLLGSSPVFASALIPQVGWTLLSVDSEETSSIDSTATNAFDGDVSTFWHTQLQEPNPRPRIDTDLGSVHDLVGFRSHWIDIDLGSVHDLVGFRYSPRQDGGVNGRVEIYVLHVSMDGVSWGSPVAAGTFRNNAQEQEVSFALIQGRYIRFAKLSEGNGQPWTSVAELNLLGAAASSVNIEPNGVIDTPGDGVTVEVGGALNFTSSGSDPDSNALLSYHWTFGDPTVPDLTVEDPLTVVFNMSGTHTVALTTVDHLGLADSTPATIQVTVNVPSAPRVIPQTGWSLLSVDSERTSGDGGLATNAFDEDVNTFWHTQWQGESPSHPHMIDIDLGTVHELDGFHYLPRQDGEANGRVADYAFYVSMDGVTWGSPVVTGTFLNNAQEQEAVFARTEGRYIRFEALSEVNGQPWTSVAELNMLVTAPVGVNIEPNIGVEPPPSTTARYLSEDFENVDWADRYKVFGNLTREGGVAARTGSYGMRINVLEGQHWGGRILFDHSRHGQGGNFDEIWTRYYVRFGPNWRRNDWRMGKAGFRARSAEVCGAPCLEMTDSHKLTDSGSIAGIGYYHEGVSAADLLTQQSAYGHKFWTGSEREREQWYCVETHHVLNTPGGNNGIYQNWLDGALVADYHNIRQRDLASFDIDDSVLIAFIGGSWVADRDMSVYFDDWAVSDERIGCP